MFLHVCLVNYKELIISKNKITPNIDGTQLPYNDTYNGCSWYLLVWARISDRKCQDASLVEKNY